MAVGKIVGVPFGTTVRLRATGWTPQYDSKGQSRRRTPNEGASRVYVPARRVCSDLLLPVLQRGSCVDAGARDGPFAGVCNLFRGHCLEVLRRPDVVFHLPLCAGAADCNVDAGLTQRISEALRRAQGPQEIGLPEDLDGLDTDAELLGDGESRLFKSSGRRDRRHAPAS